MTTQKAEATFTVANWTESLITDIDGTGITAGDAYYPHRGVTQVLATYAYTGDIDGTGTVASLITYMEGPAPVLGFERFEGSIGGHEGSCVFRQIGDQDAGSVTVRIEIIPGLGTGALENMTGTADLAIAGESEDGYGVTLEYELS
ncbi:MAG: DUF3224 domain-containing protein [Actinomycetota bacterium]|nr:DUF3224 domain-containing protein [Actinomycetota bacterium]